MSPHAMSRGSAVARQRQTATPARRTLSLRGILNRTKKNRRRSKVRQAAGGSCTLRRRRVEERKCMANSLRIASYGR